MELYLSSPRITLGLSTLPVVLCPRRFTKLGNVTLLFRRRTERWPLGAKLSSDPSERHISPFRAELEMTLEIHFVMAFIDSSCFGESSSRLILELGRRMMGPEGMASSCLW